MKEPKKILILSYYWPPGSSPGVQRWLKITKYLPEFGYKPYVVSVANGSYPNIDPELEKDVHPEVEVHKTKASDPFSLYNRLQGKKGKTVSVGLSGIKDSKSVFQKLAMFVRANFFIPDARKGWNPHAFAKASELIEKEGIQLVITTGPPHSTHLIGKQLKRRFKVSWIADFRDPWTQIYYNKILPRKAYAQALDKKLEASVLSEADEVITISPGLSEQLAYTGKKPKLVFNGFDESDMGAGEQVNADKKFTLCYLGNLKPNQNIATLWQVLADMVKAYAAFSKSLELRITGNVDPALVSDLQQMGLKEHLVLEPFVAHKVATQKMQNAWQLLFIIPKTSENKYILTGKIFEYMASGTPIFAIGPVGGDADFILREANRGEMIDYQDQTSMRAYLKNAFEAFQMDHFGKENIEGVYAFSRKNQTKKLVEIIAEVSC